MGDLLSLANTVLMKKSLANQKNLASRSLGNETGDFLTKKGDFEGDLKKPVHRESHVALGLQREIGSETDGRLWSNSDETPRPIERLKSLISSDELKGLDKTISSLESIFGHVEVEVRRLALTQLASDLTNPNPSNQISKPEEGIAHTQARDGDALTAVYANNRMAALGLIPEDIRGETEPSLRLDAQELVDIRSSRALFDCWANHVALTLQAQRLVIR